MKILNTTTQKVIVEFDIGDEIPETLDHWDGSSNRNFIHRICARCGTHFYERRHKMAKLPYCSSDCRYVENRATIICAYCGKEKTIKKSGLRQKNYCGKECKDRDWSNLYPNGKSKFVDRNLVCDYCGKEFVGRHAARKYCSRICMGQARQKQSIDNFLNGGYVGKDSLPDTVREYLLLAVDNRCEKCGWTAIHPDTGKIPLQIHHKDGKWYNNILENIEILCPNCHCLTSTYGVLNIGNGRPDRLK